MSRSQTNVDRQRRKVADLHAEIKKLQDEIAADEKKVEAAKQAVDAVAAKAREVKANGEQATAEKSKRIEEIKQRCTDETRQFQRRLGELVERERQIKMETIELRDQVLNAITELTDLDAEMKDDLERLERQRDKENELLYEAKQELVGRQMDEIRLVKLIGQFAPNAPPIEKDKGMAGFPELSVPQESDTVSLDRQIASLDDLRRQLRAEVAKLTATCMIPLNRP